ncbi:hypothetical protein V502_02163 [Pseudogymnoascus sp. VKM F-4520 (FW-2644)]|nr:hypothetical protein V502_02163 [Pseudogymnoascus sp. VKM F-4520 (FW-2644)]
MLSVNGEVKLDHTKDYSPADINSLRVLMLQMMRETPETLKSGVGNWSAEAISFVEAISWASPYELSDVGFAIYAFNSC